MNAQFIKIKHRMEQGEARWAAVGVGFALVAIIALVLVTAFNGPVTTWIDGHIKTLTSY